MVLATAYKVAIRCTGTRKNGEICNQLLAKIDVDDFHGVIEFKCPRCRTVTEFR